MPTSPTLDDLTDYQARLASEVIPGERNYGRQSKNPDALPDEDDGDGVDYLAASDGRYWQLPARLRRARGSRVWRWRTISSG